MPVSAVRLSQGDYWMEMNQLTFFGQPVGTAYEDLTHEGTLQTAPGSENPAGSLRDGVLAGGSDGYHTGAAGGHRVVVNFGTQRGVNYVAVAPNGFWKPQWRFVGSPVTPVNLNALTAYSEWTSSTYTVVTGSGAPGRTWIILAGHEDAAQGKAERLYAAGVGMNNHWGDITEIVVLRVLPPSGSVLVVR